MQLIKFDYILISIFIFVLQINTESPKEFNEDIVESEIQNPESKSENSSDESSSSEDENLKVPPKNTAKVVPRPKSGRSSENSLLEDEIKATPKAITKAASEPSRSEEECSSEDEKMPTAPKPMVKISLKRKAKSSFEDNLSEDEGPPKKSAINLGAKKPAAANSSNESSSQEEKSKPKIEQKNDEAASKKPVATTLKPKMKESYSSEDEEPKKPTSISSDNFAPKPAADPKATTVPDSSSEDGSSEDEENVMDAHEGSSPMKVSILNVLI